MKKQNTWIHRNGEDEECLNLSDTSCMRRDWIWFMIFVEQIKQLSELMNHMYLLKVIWAFESWKKGRKRVVIQAAPWRKQRLSREVLLYSEIEGAELFRLAEIRIFLHRWSESSNAHLHLHILFSLLPMGFLNKLFIQLG